MNPYVLLVDVIASEPIGTTVPKLSAGFLKPLPSPDVAAGYGLMFYLVSLTPEELPTGVVHGARAVLGIVGVMAIGVVVFDEPADLIGIIDLSPILVGIYCVNILSEMVVY